MTDQDFPPRIFALLQEAIARQWEDALGAQLAEDLARAVEWIQGRYPLAKSIPQWLPIEGAPKSENYDCSFPAVLVFCPESACTYTAYFDEVWKYFGPLDHTMEETPTHWMPLPAAPSPNEEKSEN